MSLRSRLLSSLAFSAVALSCDVGTRPPDLVAEYALVSVAGTPLPAPLYPGAPSIVLADTVRLREGGTGERILASRDTAAATVSTYRSDLTWRMRGDTLTVDLTCPRGAAALCLASPFFSGRIMPGMQWVLDHAAVYELPVAFNRVAMR